MVHTIAARLGVTVTLVILHYANAANREIRLHTLAVDIDLLTGVAAETDNRMWGHGREIVLRVVDVEQEFLLIDGTLAMYPIFA